MKHLLKLIDAFFQALGRQHAHRLDELVVRGLVLRPLHFVVAVVGRLHHPLQFLGSARETQVGVLNEAPWT